MSSEASRIDGMRVFIGVFYLPFYNCLSFKIRRRIPKKRCEIWFMVLRTLRIISDRNSRGKKRAHIDLGAAVGAASPLGRIALAHPKPAKIISNGT